jgi:hypothetical protein
VAVQPNITEGRKIDGLEGAFIYQPLKMPL